MGKKVHNILNFKSVRRICADHALGLQARKSIVVNLDDGSSTKVELLTTAQAGGIGYRTEVKTVEKTPRLGVIAISRVNFGNETLSFENFINPLFTIIHRWHK